MIAAGISTGDIALLVSVVGGIVGILVYLNQRSSSKDSNKIAADAVRAQDEANEVQERQANWAELNDTIDNLRDNLREATDEQATLRRELDDATGVQEKLARSLQAAQANITILQQYIERHMPADAPAPPQLWKVQN